MRSISVISLAMVVWRSSVIRRSWSQNSGSTLIEVLWPSRTTVRLNGDCSRLIDRSILQHAPSPSITSRRGSGRSGHVEPLLLHGGRVVKTLSVVFLADFEQHWRTHGKKVLDILAEKYPQAYFGGAVALAKTIRWDTGTEEMFDGAMTPEEIMDKLEQRVGPKGRKLFEQFLRKVNKLHAQQYLEARAQRGDTEGSGERGPG